MILQLKSHGSPIQQRSQKKMMQSKKLSMMLPRHLLTQLQTLTQSKTVTILICKHWLPLRARAICRRFRTAGKKSYNLWSILNKRNVMLLSKSSVASRVSFKSFMISLCLFTLNWKTGRKSLTISLLSTAKILSSIEKEKMNFKPRSMWIML